MKKIILSLLLGAGLLSSCNMDKNPVGTLNGDDPFSGMNDASRYRNYIYANIRSVTSSGYFTYPEIEMDMFQATNQVGNRGIVFASGDVLPSTGETGTYFDALVLQVGSVNYFLAKMEELLTTTDDPETLLSYNRFIGEAKFARAYFNSLLLDRFCPEYTEANADKAALGIPVFTTYNPTADRTTYYGRSTMRESVEFINKDLDEAIVPILAYENDSRANAPMPMDAYVSSNCVKALQARIALLTLDYQTAIEKANEVINTGKYPLVTYANYAAMWSDDNGTEIIFRPYCSAPNELPSSIGSTWLSIYVDQADYVPTQACLDMYSRRIDARYSAFFDTRDLNFEGDIVTAYTFNKFPGNSALQTSTALNLMNMPKPFRTSELYLIVAEASYELGNTTDANNALTAIRTARMRSYTATEYTGDELRDEIRTERTKELIGEGFRMSDLRRWHLAMNRSNPQEDLSGYLWNSTVSMNFPANSYKFTWPIPLSELQVNPQMAGQQNPGY